MKTKKILLFLIFMMSFDIGFSYGLTLKRSHSLQVDLNSDFYLNNNYSLLNDFNLFNDHNLFCDFNLFNKYDLLFDTDLNKKFCKEENKQEVKNTLSDTLNSEIISISLEEALKRAEDNNAKYLQTSLDLGIAKEQALSADAIFLPQIVASYNALLSNNPLNAFGFKLNQGIATEADFNPELLNNPGITRDYYGEISVNQTLLNVDAIYKRKGARLMYDMKKMSRKHALEFLRFNVKQAYLSIALSYNNFEVFKKAVNTAREFEKRTKSMYNEGLIQQADLLEAEAYLLDMQTKFQKARSEISNSCDNLSFIMGDEAGVLYSTTKEMWNIDGQIEFSNVSNRKDVLAYKIGLKAAKSMENSYKMKLLPRINAFGLYQLHDNTMLSFDKKTYMMGVNLSWKLFSGMQRKHEIKTAKLNTAKMNSRLNELQRQVKLEYNKTIRQYNDLQLENEHALLMVKQTSEALRIQNDRYKEGLSTVSDLLRIQTQLAKNSLLLEMAVFKKNITIAYLDVIAPNN